MTENIPKVKTQVFIYLCKSEHAMGPHMSSEAAGAIECLAGRFIFTDSDGSGKCQECGRLFAPEDIIQIDLWP
jgi:hypothetical protein